MSGPVEPSLRVTLLGQVRAWWGPHELELGPPKQQAVIAVLAMNAGRPVPRAELAAAVWDTADGASDATLYTYVSRLRGALEPGRPGGRPGLLAGLGPAYLLRVEPSRVDALAFAAGLAAARKARSAGHLAGAAAEYAAALRMWQGTPLAGMTTTWARAERGRLTEERLAAAEEQAEVKLALGLDSEVSADLARLVGSYPLREDLRRVLMLALYRSGRLSEALAVYEDTRRVLAAERGTEPGPKLRRLREQMVAADPSLAGSAAAGTQAAASSAAPHELPGEVSAFTGRSSELAELDRLIPGRGHKDAAGGHQGVVLCVVSGMAGVGKTALVVRWAHRVQAQFPDGQLYVNLRGYDPDAPLAAADVLAQFLRALGLADSDIPLGEVERAARYRSAVSGKRLLVVLDNANTVDQVRPLLPGTGTAMVVVTSRDSLAGLVARDGAHRLGLGQLPTQQAMALLGSLIGERVAADPASGETLVTQCAGLPLALRVAAELAVSRPSTPLADLTAEFSSLQDRLALLDAGGDPRGAIATVFSWSYRHLRPDAARMFRLLALHPGEDWDLRAAAAVAGTSVAGTGALLTVLARANLVQHRGRNRYAMHDLLRAYAVEESRRRDRAEDRRAALSRLFDYYLAACAAAMDRLAPAERYRRPDPPPAAALPDLADEASARAWLDTELPSLTAMSAYTARHGWPSHATRLASTIGSNYLVTDHYTEGLVIIGHALAAARASGDLASQARALAGLGHIHSRQGRPGESLRCLEQALACAREAGERLIEARALGGIASSYSRQGRYQQAREHYLQALALYQQLGDRVGEAINLSNLGLVWMRQGDYRQAAATYEQALALFQDMGHRAGEANTLHNLGEAYYRQGMYTPATAYHRQALILARECGSQLVEAHAANGLGDVLCRQGHYAEALASYEEAFARYSDIGDRSGEADALNGAGEALGAGGHPGEASTRHAGALSLARESGNQREQARALAGLGAVCRAQGRYDDAVRSLDEALVLYRLIGDRGGESDVLNSAGETLREAGEPARARASHATALDLARDTGDAYQHARARQGLASACEALGHVEEAAEHRRVAAGMFAGLGVPHVPQPAPSPGPSGRQPASPSPPAPGPAAPSPASGPPAPGTATRPDQSSTARPPAAAGPAATEAEAPVLALRFGVLGALEVWHRDMLRTPSAPMVRRVLALLLLRANHVVPASTLIEELWGEDLPPSAATTVQTYVYQVRRVLPRGPGAGGRSEWLTTAPPGYRLRVTPGQVDVHEFEALAGRGRALLDEGQAGEAATLLRSALALWRGPMLANVVMGRLLSAHAVHWEEERLHALELRVRADAALGRHQALIGELRSLVSEYPLNESFQGHLIAALGHSGRRAEALAAYQSLRAVLRDELGLDPRPELQRLQRSLLAGEPLPVPWPGGMASTSAAED